MKRIIILFSFSLFCFQLNLISNPISLPKDSIIYNYPCNTNTFWTINTNGDIQEWQLNNGLVTGGNIILNNNLGFSLSYCGTATSQTFYTEDRYGFSYFNSPNWITDMDSILNYGNSGGYKQFQYYQSGTGNLYYFNGINFSLIFTGNIQVADEAVDTLGRVWVVTEDFFGNAFLNVLDSSGNLKMQYTDSSVISLNNTYGSFFLQDTLYVGFGNSNTFFRGKIVPIVLNGNKFQFGNPINFPDTNTVHFADMASCMGNTNRITNIYSEKEKQGATIYPNPTSGILNVELGMLNENTNLHITDILGNMVKQIKIQNSKFTINVANLNEGVYNIVIQNSDFRITKRLVIVH